MPNPIKVISLDRTPERFASFEKFNPNLPIERVSACEGGTLDKEGYITSGVFSEKLAHSIGAMGSAISHICLWQEAASENAVRHIAEDDAIIRDDFYQIFAQADASLKDWDILLWGYNDDWPVGVLSYFGQVLALQGKILPPQFLAENYNAFKSDQEKPSILRLASAAGIGFYSVSPKGAKKLLEICLPLTGEIARYAKDTDMGWSNTALDVEMSRHYGDMNAYVSYPPMALMINDSENSTIIGKEQFQQ